jgi:hypothetical protein
LLQHAIEQNYCAHSNLLYDPLLAKVRSSPGFNDLLIAATNCQKTMRESASEPGK